MSACNETAAWDTCNICVDMSVVFEGVVMFRGGPATVSEHRASAREDVNVCKQLAVAREHLAIVSETLVCELIFGVCVDFVGVSEHITDLSGDSVSVPCVLCSLCGDSGSVPGGLGIASEHTTCFSGGTSNVRGIIADVSLAEGRTGCSGLMAADFTQLDGVPVSPELSITCLPRLLPLLSSPPGTDVDDDGRCSLSSARSL